MATRFLRNSDNELFGVVDNDDYTATSPNTIIDKSILDTWAAAQTPPYDGDFLWGKWDGSVFTPSTLFGGYDLTTDVGKVQEAAENVQQWTVTKLQDLNTQIGFTDTDTKNARDILIGNMRGAYLDGIDSNKTLALRLQILEFAADWPDGVSDIFDFISVCAALTSIKVGDPIRWSLNNAKRGIADSIMATDTDYPNQPDWLDLKLSGSLWVQGIA